MPIDPRWKAGITAPLVSFHPPQKVSPVTLASQGGGKSAQEILDRFGSFAFPSRHEERNRTEIASQNLRDSLTIHSTDFSSIHNYFGDCGEFSIGARSAVLNSGS
jgi:hypothetical protein